MMKSNKISFLAGSLVLGLAAMPACDSSDDEAEQQALAIEEDHQAAQDKEEITEHDKPPIDDFHLEADVTPAAGPPGKCCKAICFGQSGWKQLPWNVTENCNDYARLYCGYYNVVDAQWRTCG